VFDTVCDVEQATAAVARLMDDHGAWAAASRRVKEHSHERHSVAAVVSLYEAEINRLAGLRTA
jgi:hypothetical protein